jgi:hypothetical protein
MAKPLAHDKRVCLYAAETLAERRNGGPVYADRFPDEEERRRPAIDLIAHDTMGSIGVEHTLIEAYEQQVRDNQRVNEVFNGFAERFGHSLPSPGLYTLAIPTRGAHEFPRKDQAQLLDSLERWVRAKQLPEPRIPPTAPNHVVARPPEVPVPLTLYRASCAPEDEGALRVALLRSSDHQEQRVVRIGRALREKLDKLEASRPPDGVTLLVLETRDFIMSNPIVVAQALYRAAQKHRAVPDVIIHVDTTAGDGHWIGYYEKFGEWWSERARGI